MPTAMNLKPLTDRQQWKVCAPVISTTTTSAHFFAATPARWPVPRLFFSLASTQQYFYEPRQDSWIQIPSGTLGAHSSGSCATFHPFGPTGTASAGTSTTMTTATTLNSDVSDHEVRITSGTGAGQARTISSNTIGANSVLTVSTPWSVTPDATSTYVLLTGRFYCLAGTGSAIVFKYYDIATGAWTSRSVTSGPPSNFTGMSAITATSSALEISLLATGTATAGSSTTLTNSTKAWTTNQWANSQVRITGGTGAGQIRVINSNTGTALTVSAAWSVTPDATSTYAIEGCDDWIYVVGSAAVAMYRYAISGTAGLSTNAQATGDTWITVSPGVARGSAPSNGCSLSWIGDSPDARFNTENSILNGRRLYSFGAGSQFTCHIYDIPSNAWSTNTYNTVGPNATGFYIGTSWCDHAGVMYCHKDGSGRFYRFNAAKNLLESQAYLGYPINGSAIELNGSTFVFSKTDGTTEMVWLYSIRQGGSEMFRLLLV